MVLHASNPHSLHLQKLGSVSSCSVFFIQLMHDNRTTQKSLLYQYYINMVQVTWRSIYKPCIFWCWTYLSFRICFHALHLCSFWYISFVFIATYWALLVRVHAQKYMTSISSFAHDPSAQGMIIFASGLIYP